MHGNPPHPLRPSAGSRALLVAWLVMLPSLAAADTNIGGGAVSGVWTLAGSPYHVLGDVNIPEGDTLRIEPGVTIDFANYPQLKVYGVLEAVGTEADSIRFTGPGQWRGVAFHNPDAASHLTYCVLEAPGFQQIGISGSCPHQFAHCALRNSGKGVNMWGTTGTLTFANCSITDCTVGMEVNDVASVTMTACHIGANDDGIKVVANCTLTMIDCRIVGNRNDLGDTGGITLEQGTLVMEGCELSANWVGPGWSSAGSALNVLNGSSATLDRCTIAGNEGREAAVYIGYSASATMTNSIVTHNSPLGIFNNLGSLSVRHSDFFDNWFGHVQGAPTGFGHLVDTNANGDSCDVYGNIFFDPLYVDQPGGDLHLTAGSPCIDAGDPEHPVDPDGTPVDMGAYYFHQTSGAGEWPQPAHDFALEVYPNPATARASIEFIAPRDGRFRIDVFDLSGRRVAALANRDLTAGPHTVVWSGCDSRGRTLPTGMYLLRLATDINVVTRRVTMLR